MSKSIPLLYNDETGKWEEIYPIANCDKKGTVYLIRDIDEYNNINEENKSYSVFSVKALEQLGLLQIPG